jgi:uncharacterized RDD family membrane protein YckC
MTVPPAADGSRPITVVPAGPGPAVTVPPAAGPGPAVSTPPAAEPGPAVSTPPAAEPAQAIAAPPVAQLGFQGHFAGAVSRFLAYVTDVAVGTAVYTLAVAGVGFVVSVITSKSVTWSRANIVVEILYFAWMFVYFAYSWAASGKTLGMAALGVRVVSADGADATVRQAVIRTLAFPLSFLLLGLGFLGILVQNDRRALHDLIAGTAVVYSWDARAARLRFLARDKSRAAG